MEHDREDPITNTGSESKHSASGTCVEDTDIVPDTVRNADRLFVDPSTPRQANTTNDTNDEARGRASTSCMAYLRQLYRNKHISSVGMELLLASWRTKSSKSYDSLFGKLVCLCHQGGADPISEPISDVVNFLAHLHEEGYQHCLLNAYRSAISSVHTRSGLEWIVIMYSNTH